MNFEKRDIENKINELARKAIPSGWDLQGFIELPLKEKIFGIKLFATMAEDDKIVKLCEHAERVL